MSKFLKSIIIIACLVVGYYLFVSMFGSFSTSVTFGNGVDTLTLTGPRKTSEVIAYEDIEKLELIDLTDFGTALDGGKFLRSYYGTWENEQLGQYRLFFSGSLGSTSKNTKAILITKNDGSKIAFNSTDNTETSNMFTMFTQLLESKRS